MGMLDTTLNAIIRKPHFSWSVVATAILLSMVWMKSGGPPPNLAPSANDAVLRLIQESYPTFWYAERAHDLIFYLIIYLAAIVLIWSHAFLWTRKTIPQANTVTVPAPE
jgi:hypothetical protein